MLETPMDTLPTLASLVTVSDDVLFQDLHGEAVLLNLKTGVYFGLDPVGKRVWDLLQTHARLSELLAAMVAEYDVTEERCAEDLLALVGEMHRYQIVTLT